MSIELNKLCELIVDCPHSTAVDEGIGYPLIRTPNIDAGYFNLEGVHRVSRAVYDKRNQRAIPKPGDLILAREAPAGNVAIIPEGAEFCLGQRTVLIRPDASKVYPPFLNYYLNAPEQRHKLLRNANGATVSHVNMPIIRNLPIELPSMKDQRRVAGILAAYDSLIENNRKRIKLLEEASHRLYKEWFIDLNFPGHETAKINSETGLPEGWVSQKLYETVNVIRGVSYTSDTLSTAKGKRLLNLGNLMPYGGFRDGYEKYYLGKFGEHHVLSSGDIVLGLTEQAEGLAGYAARIPSYLKGSLFSADLALLQPLQLSSEYLYASLRYGNISRTLSPFASGAKIKHLKPDHLRGVEIVVADEATVKSFSETARLLLSKQDVCRQAINCLREARDRLLPKLMEACND